MTNSEKILEIVRQNNGMITTSMVIDAGFSRGNLKYLSDNGILEHVSRGVYTLPEVWEDEFVNIQNRFKRGVYSLETALFLNDMTDRTPSKFHMTFPATYNLSGPKQYGVLCSSVKEPFYCLGIVSLTTPGGNKVRSYSAERTLCDILKTRNHTDVQIVTDAFKRYTKSKVMNIPLLSEYASQLNVEGKLRSYLEVLL